MTIHKVSHVGRKIVTNNLTSKKEEILVHKGLIGGSKSLAKAISFAARQNCDTIVS